MINAKITDIPVPVTRTEHFMYSAITGNESGLKADTQAEMYLDAIKNSDTSDLEGLEPRTVLDMYLEARQTGVIDDLPKPRTTSEMLLYQAITGEDLGAKPVSNMDKYLSLLEPNNYDARLEIESEESVIHLTDSKNGVVEVKELEGNTMVNYATDGAKELTLNGDIDVEGTNVTLTEGVDNGLVDVACEGNTLLNLWRKIRHTNEFNLDESTYGSRYGENGFVEVKTNGSNWLTPGATDVALMKPNTVYTVIFEIKDSTYTSDKVVYVNVNYPYTDSTTGENLNESCIQSDTNTPLVNGITTHKFTTREHFNGCLYSLRTQFQPQLTGEGSCKFRVIMLEGDWTNKEIPTEYFEGMKSVGECEDNKIEIVSQNKNLFDIKDGWKVGRTINHLTGEEINYPNEMCTDFIDIKPNTQYYLKSYNYVTSHASPVTIYFYDINKRVIERSASGHGLSFSGKYEGSFISPQNAEYIRARLVTNDTSVLVQLEEGSVATSYVPYTTNKKEITLSEPLRALPNGVKDKIVKICGKWYVERNCGSVVFDGSADEGFVYNTIYEDIGVLQFTTKIPTGNRYKQMICNNFKWLDTLTPYDNSGWIRSNNNGYAMIFIDKNKLNTLDVVGFNKWLSENPTTVVYQLETPTYEEVPYETQKLILEGYLNGTLFFDTNIPPTVTASYTANIPLVSKVNEVNETTEINTEDIAITQMAVDFLLMSSLGEEMLNVKVRSGYNMASYFANRIIKGALKYEDVINKYPQYKEDINSILISEGHSDLIVEL